MSEQIIEIEAESLEEARAQVKSQIPQGLHLLFEQVISDGKPKTVEAVADTTEEAIAKARREIPDNASIIAEKKLITPEQKVIIVEAFGKDDVEMRVRMDHRIGRSTIIKGIKLTIPGSKGFLGMGKKPDQYEIEIFRRAEVEITYKAKAKIAATIGDKPSTRAVKIPSPPATLVVSTPLSHYDKDDILLLRLRNDVQALAAALSYKEDAAIRSQAAQSLGYIKDARAVEPLIAALRDEDVGVRRTVAGVLGDMKDARAVEPLITALKDQDSYMRYDAATALGHIKDTRTLDPLIAALKHEDYRTRWGAVSALRHFNVERVIKSLIAILNDETEHIHVRGCAIATLVDLRNSEAVLPLTEILEDRHEEIREDTVRALGEFKDSRAVEPLIDHLLKEKSLQVCASILSALVSIEDPRAVEPLTILKETPGHEALQRNIAEALKRLTAPKAKQIRGPLAEVTDRLVAIYQKHPEGLVRSIGGPDVEEVRRIGEMLNKQGGMSLMLAVHHEFARTQGWAARNLEMVWDGIGEWRG